MDDKKTQMPSTAKKWFKATLGKVMLLLVGFAAGYLAYSGSSAESPSAHDEHARTPGDAHADEIWTCSMHPQIRQNTPGQCPICGMDLVLVNSSGPRQASSATQLVLSDRAQALAKLRTTPVRRRSQAVADLRLLGRIETNETSLKSITAWTGGRIDRLHVNVTGERVRAGQVIATLYSPEVFAAHQDLLIAKRQVVRMAQSPESSRHAAAAALEAARERLRLIGVPDNELARMETDEKPTRAVAIRTPFSGTVIERTATEGAYVSTGTQLYRLANLSKLWVQLDAYESDLPSIKLHDEVRVSVDALPDEEFEGAVAFIDPTINARTRTAQVRVVIENPEGRLRPGMFAQATVASGAAQGDASPLVVPASAPLFTGRRAVVYVELHDGKRPVYEARTVRLGPRLGDSYPVVAGLAEGERVVSRGAFALDADLQIRGGNSMMTMSDDRTQDVADATLKLAAADKTKLVPVVEAYLQIQASLAEDDLPSAKAAAETLVTTLEDIHITQPLQAATQWTKVATGLTQHGRHVNMAKNLEHARAGFEALSKEIEAMLRRFGNPLSTPLRIAFCPMAAGSQGASWVQRGEKIDNSYFGKSMRSCGEIKQEVGSGDYLAQPKAATATKQAPEVAGGHQH